MAPPLLEHPTTPLLGQEAMALLPPWHLPMVVEPLLALPPWLLPTGHLEVAMVVAAATVVVSVKGAALVGSAAGKACGER